MGKIGVDASSEDDGDAEMLDAPALPLLPKKPSSSTETSKKSKKKPAIESANIQEVAAETPKKKKSSKKPVENKRKHSTSDDEALAAASQLVSESQSAETKSKKQKVGRDGSVDLGSTAVERNTPVLPPTIPTSSYSFSSLPPTHDATSTPSGNKKASKEKNAVSMAKTPTSVSNGVKQTPVPVPTFGTATKVPPPSSSAVTAPSPLVTKAEKKASKKSKKQTAVPAPGIGSH
jgi:hypothetical protein